MGIVEIHTWNSTAENIERPNRIVWDLDPGPAVRWTAVVAAARLLRTVLQTLGLESWVKTTGGQGLHVVAPIRPRRDWSECLAFARTVSEVIVRSNPTLYTTAFSKRGRERKILLDYLRNNRTNTSIAAYSPRSRPGAPVSIPVSWDELRGSRRQWTLGAVVDRLRRLKEDPWGSYWVSSQGLARESVRALARFEF
jgi:bifunctional non-homologous end joining protein LigD